MVRIGQTLPLRGPAHPGDRGLGPGAPEEAQRLLQVVSVHAHEQRDRLAPGGDYHLVPFPRGLEDRRAVRYLPRRTWDGPLSR
jgi:hypothetical protein